MKKEDKQTMNIEELRQDGHNFNKGTHEGQRLIEKSFKELGAGRSILIDKDNNIIAGNKSQQAAIASGIQKVRVIETDGTELIAVKRTDVELDSAKGRLLAFADNKTAEVNLSWDEVQLSQIETEVEDFRSIDWNHEISSPLDEAEQIAQKRKEFEERMAAGEIDETDPEYQAFIEKFKPKKTTDDCYTPEYIYDAVATFVCEEFGLKRSQFKRPFYPGGDYQKEKYEVGEVVVDNPPFSIISEIVSFYSERKIPFFLFAPTLTLFTGNASKHCTFLPLGVTITYGNGAVVNSSFVTNLYPSDIILYNAPKLYKLVKEAEEKAKDERNKRVAKYRYDDHLLFSHQIDKISEAGLEFTLHRDECALLSKLDCQSEMGKAMFGKAFLLNDKKTDEFVALKKEAEALKKEAERKRTIVWDFSEREFAILKELNDKTT